MELYYAVNVFVEYVLPIILMVAALGGLARLLRCVSERLLRYVLAGVVVSRPATSKRDSSWIASAEKVSDCRFHGWLARADGSDRVQLLPDTGMYFYDVHELRAAASQKFKSVGRPGDALYSEGTYRTRGKPFAKLSDRSGTQQTGAVPVSITSPVPKAVRRPKPLPLPGAAVIAELHKIADRERFAEGSRGACAYKDALDCIREFELLRPDEYDALTPAGESASALFVEQLTALLNTMRYQAEVATTQRVNSVATNRNFVRTKYRAEQDNELDDTKGEHSGQ